MFLFRKKNANEPTLIGLMKEFDCDSVYQKLFRKNDFNYYETVVEQPIGKILFRKFCEKKHEKSNDYLKLLMIIEHRNFEMKETRNKFQIELEQLFPKPKSLKRSDPLLAEYVSELIDESPDSKRINQLVNYIHLVMSTKIFPGFLESFYFDLFLKFKSLEIKMATENGFQRGKFLCTGTCSDVYACTSKLTRAQFACKYFEKSKIAIKKLEKNTVYEKQILEEIDSQFVLNLFCAFETKTHLCLVVNFMSGGDLYRHIYFETNRNGLGFCRAQFYAAEIVCGLLYLHSKDIIHLDLKPENILLDAKGHVRIGDLGLAVKLGKGEKMRGLMGTIIYMAPEMLKEEFYDSAVDWFSFGCVLYEMIEGSNPFQKLATLHTKTDIKTLVKHYEEKYSKRFQDSAMHLCMQLLQKTPKSRTFYGDVIPLEKQIKNDDFFNGIDWSLLENGQLKPPFVPKNNTDYANGFRSKKSTKAVRNWKPDDANLMLYRKFNTGAAPRNWQKDVIKSGLFNELRT